MRCAKQTPSLWRWPRSKEPENYQNTKHLADSPIKAAGLERRSNLIEETPVHILPEKCLSNGRESIDLQKSQSLLEGIVDLDLAISTDDNHTARTIQHSVSLYHRDMHQ